jgi:hypothetical protein
MDKSDSPAGNDRVQASPSQHSDGSAQALHNDASFNKVGDSSGNQAWSQMSGQSLKGSGGGDKAHDNGSDIAGGQAGSGSMGADSAPPPPSDAHGGKGGDTSTSMAGGSSFDNRGNHQSDMAPPPPSTGHDKMDAGDGGKSSKSLDAAPPLSAGHSHGKMDGADGGKGEGIGGPSGGGNNGDGGSADNSGKAQGGHTYDGDNQAGGSNASDSKSFSGSDKQSDSKPADAPSENYGVPDTQLPSAEQVKNGSLQDLQKMASDSRQATENYVASQGNAIPELAFHGTSQKNSDNMTKAINPGGEIWVAGLHKGQRSEGASRHTEGLRDASQTSRAFADNPKKSEGEPGPVHIYNAGNQPEAWGKTPNTTPKTEYGMLDLKNADMIGKVSREQLDSTAQANKAVESALQSKIDEYKSQQGGSISKSQMDDVSDRGQAFNSMRSDRELQMHLNVVAKYNAERGVEAQPKQDTAPAKEEAAGAKGSGWSRFLARFRSGE